MPKKKKERGKKGYLAWQNFKRFKRISNKIFKKKQRKNKNRD